jgi:hypothetical protein
VNPTQLVAVGPQPPSPGAAHFEHCALRASRVDEERGFAGGELAIQDQKWLLRLLSHVMPGEHDEQHTASAAPNLDTRMRSTKIGEDSIGYG